MLRIILAQRRFLLIGLALLALVVCIVQTYVLLAEPRGFPSLPKLKDFGTAIKSNSKDASSKGMPTGSSDWQRPDDIKKIMGLVFYGRRATVSILDCYLKRNLAKNGGWLDGVIWLERTSNSNDLAFLDKLIESEPEYFRQKVNTTVGGYASAYDEIEDDILYIKIDDDIVYIEDAAIPSIVRTKVDHPEYYVVSANVVNQPLFSWIHWNLGAVKPYLPEIDKAYIEPQRGHSMDWRPSHLPAWDGPAGFEVQSWTSPDGQKHRWLPVSRTVHNSSTKTPIEVTEYDAFGRGLTMWHIGAQQHYSLLENIEKNELWRYKFRTWDFQYQRMGIQFIAMMGRDINIAKPIYWDDEGYFSTDIPKKLGRHAVADGKGVVAHYSFANQAGDDALKTTDILDRYRSFALEKVCQGSMLWMSDEESTDE